jgi:drug/metabolite transporter (DMT)-like permease
MVNSQAIVSLAADGAYVTSSTASKKATTALGITSVLFLTIVFNIIPAGVVIAIWGFGTPVPAFDVFLSVVAGLFYILGMILVFRSLHTESLTTTIAMGEVWPALLVILGLVFLGESFTYIQLLAVLLIFGGAAFVITTEGMRVNKKLLPALFANISWGVYWIILTYAIQGSNNFAVTMEITRIVGIAILIIYVFSKSEYQKDIKRLFAKMSKPSSSFMFLFVLGVLTAFGDGTGDTVIASVINAKTAAIAGAISALSPILTSILAYFIYKDRLTRLQYMGFAAMIIGAVILSST